MKMQINLLRRFIPKGTSIGKYTDVQIKKKRKLDQQSAQEKYLIIKQLMRWDETSIKKSFFRMRYLTIYQFTHIIS